MATISPLKPGAGGGGSASGACTLMLAVYARGLYWVKRAFAGVWAP